jgi:hypothetical protein
MRKRKPEESVVIMQVKKTRLRTHGKPVFKVDFLESRGFIVESIYIDSKDYNSLTNVMYENQI